MTLFVDASALVAIIAQEDGYEALSDRIVADGQPLWSAISRWETIRALARLLGMPMDQAEQMVEDFTVGLFELVSIGEREAIMAVAAHKNFGKGNHPAQLNMGDCFAYACAKANGGKLLYKGDDFAKTDLA